MSDYKETEHVIVINNVQWKIVDPVNFIVERFGRQARVIWKKGVPKLFLRNIVNGRFLSQRVAVK